MSSPVIKHILTWPMLALDFQNAMLTSSIWRKMGQKTYELFKQFGKILRLGIELNNKQSSESCIKDLAWQLYFVLS